MKTLTIMFLVAVTILTADALMGHDTHHGSPSTLGNSVGTWYPADGRWWSKICDQTDNGRADWQTVFTRGNGQILFVAGRNVDPDGFGGRCGYQDYERDKAAHQVVSRRGGSLSVHDR